MQLRCFHYMFVAGHAGIRSTKAIQNTSNKVVWLRNFSSKPRNPITRNYISAAGHTCICTGQLDGVLNGNHARNELVLAELFENVFVKWERSENEHARTAGEIMRKVLASLSELGGVSRLIAATTTNLDANLQTNPPRRHTNIDSSIAKALDMVWDDLPWKESKHLCKNFTDVMAAKDMKTAMLIGDTQTCGALLHSDDIYFGLLHLGSNTIYPAHSHDALELYDVLTTGADWCRDGEWKRGVSAGSFRFGTFLHGTVTATLIHCHDTHHHRDTRCCRYHPSRCSHAITTREQPLLALYLWWGNVAGEHLLVFRTCICCASWHVFVGPRSILV